MKKLVALLLACCMVLGCASAMAETLGEEDLQALYEAEMHEARYIVNRGAAYEYDSFIDYMHYWFQKPYTLIDSPKKALSEVENAAELLLTLKAKREALVQTTDDPESVCWYIWGENMAEAEGAASYDYTQMYDEPGFKPFLVPYLLPDQAETKGNVVIIAGGGFNQRCNDGEGYPVAKFFNEIGFNAYVLQRRVLPSEPIDASLDLQRAIRYIRYNAETLGIAKAEDIVTIGFSGGGMTILNQLNTCYGDITPDAIYPSYVCDDVDKVNADYPITAIFYGATKGYTTENPNMPDMFLCAGGEDNKLPFMGTVDLFTVASENGWPVELYIPQGAPHGFGFGVRAFSDIGYYQAAQAPALMEMFLNVRLGYQPATY